MLATLYLASALVASLKGKFLEKKITALRNLIVLLRSSCHDLNEPLSPPILRVVRNHALY